MSPFERDPFARFRNATRARIGLGRAGDALPTSAILDFQLAHARARDAVHGHVDFVALAKQLAPVPTVRIRSRAKDRTIYLARPDLGRQTNADDLPNPGDRYDIAFIIADGLSASAVEHHAVPLFKACMKRLGGFSIAPVVLGEQARVAFGDEAAAAFGAEVAIVLIGERPGLSVPDSLGAYITFRPQSGRRDSERNCISNIHADGLSYEVAADKIVWIVREALRLQLTGVDLKENAEGAIEALPHQEA
ncbi:MULTISPECIES: ethanolamine ammonia-lyase subunit EutC [Rhizobium]|uniref:Ethanolamine ammonia-lyase small subunit n=1 Tax=Rhizobium esperanzae TaxID=1967781 RepID=A0A7W6UQL3_9HYPH|nr:MULTISPECIES: ethanolamine ammonia-lyase subunit EutC [Rhizobium]MBB4442499.1 ethanolamine ammonia-lyase small subunit [Rhizobium esperanzae]MDH6205270.1 ethanolamine ammonia-lyase small subunit [Rhizobium leguminosarum]OAV56653.1 ethanolamine ammonia-lyase [Rhizobium sp. WYCCWR10014]